MHSPASNVANSTFHSTATPAFDTATAYHRQLEQGAMRRDIDLESLRRAKAVSANLNDAIRWIRLRDGRLGARRNPRRGSHDTQELGNRKPGAGDD